MKVTKYTHEALQYAEEYQKKVLKWPEKPLTVNTLFMGALKVASKYSKAEEVVKFAEKVSSAFDTGVYELSGRLRAQISTELTEEDLELAKDMYNSIAELDKVMTLSILFDILMKHSSSEMRSLMPRRRPRVESVEPMYQPVSRKDSEDSIEKLILARRKLQEHLNEKIIGQDHAVNMVVDGFWNSELAYLSAKEAKPVRGLYLFAGPAGVGKTYMAEEIARFFDIPCKKFDMSGYSMRDAVNELTGFAKTYAGAKRGIMTEFVAENPRCILIFDEIEKANRDVILLFLQMLDSGYLEEKYDGTPVSFHNANVIFTTNAAKELYEDLENGDASAVTPQMVLDALKESRDRLEQHVFPSEICSRLGTGNVTLFNSLSIHALERIARKQFEEVASQMEKTFGIALESDDETLASLILEDGGMGDARTMTAKIGNFIRNEYKKLFDLFDEDSLTETLGSIGRIAFRSEIEDAPKHIQKLYKLQEKQNILLIGANTVLPLTIQGLEKGNYHVLQADTMEEVQAILDTQVVDIAVIQLDSNMLLEEEVADKHEVTRFGFNFIPLGASDLKDNRRIIKYMHRYAPATPVYVLTTELLRINRELEIGLYREGVKGFITNATHRGEVNAFVQKMDEIAKGIYLQKQAQILKDAHKSLKFDTTPKVEQLSNTIIVRLRDFEMVQNIEVRDRNEMVVDVERIHERFSDVIGAENAKKELAAFTEYLTNPRSFYMDNIDIPKGVLLYGKPGTGKTMLAKALAGEAKVAFFSAVGSDFLRKYYGEGPKMIRKLFAKARRYAPSIIFIDEIDAIGKQRNGSTTQPEEILNALLAEMDGVKTDPKKPVFVIAATNYGVAGDEQGIGLIDEALARRFDRKIRVELPNRMAREEFLCVMLKEVKQANVTPSGIKQIADRSVGMSLAELKNVLKLAVKLAREAKKRLDVTDLDKALEEIVHGSEREWGPEYMERIARHEAGHALLECKAGFRPNYITIIARGDHGGYVQSSEENIPIYTKDQLLGKIRSALGGRAAEQVYYPEAGLSTSASSDLQVATAYAKAIICRYGMDDDLGLMVYDKEDMKNPYVAEKIFTKVNALLKEELKKAVEEIEANKAIIDGMVDKLLEVNYLNAEEIEAIFNGDVAEEEAYDGFQDMNW